MGLQELASLWDNAMVLLNSVSVEVSMIILQARLLGLSRARLWLHYSTTTVVIPLIHVKKECGWHCSLGVPACPQAFVVMTNTIIQAHCGCFNPTSTTNFCDLEWFLNLHVLIFSFVKISLMLASGWRALSQNILKSLRCLRSAEWLPLTSLRLANCVECV